MIVEYRPSFRPELAPAAVYRKARKQGRLDPVDPKAYGIRYTGGISCLYVDVGAILVLSPSTKPEPGQLVYVRDSKGRPSVLRHFRVASRVYLIGDRDPALDLMFPLITRQIPVRRITPIRSIDNEAGQIIGPTRPEAELRAWAAHRLLNYMRYEVIYTGYIPSDAAWQQAESIAHRLIDAWNATGDGPAVIYPTAPGAAVAA